MMLCVAYVCKLARPPTFSSSPPSQHLAHHGEDANRTTPHADCLSRCHGPVCASTIQALPMKHLHLRNSDPMFVHEKQEDAFCTPRLTSRSLSPPPVLNPHHEHHVHEMDAYLMGLIACCWVNASVQEQVAGATCEGVANLKFHSKIIENERMHRLAAITQTTKFHPPPDHTILKFPHTPQYSSPLYPSLLPLIRSLLPFFSSPFFPFFFFVPSIT